MKIGVIGLGSIGQRHVRCLTKLGYKQIFALRSKKGVQKDLPPDLLHVNEVFDYSTFFNLKLDGVIISNPTALHINTLKKVLKHKLPVLLEKPLGASTSELKQLINLDTSLVMMGFCLRYSPIIRMIVAILKKGVLGRILKVRLYCGQFLPLWHPDRDYRNEYFSKSILGGGVLRTLCHELDLAAYLFGEVREVWANIGKLSSLEIDVEDNVFMLLKTKGGSFINIELDFLNTKTTRNGIIFGSKATLEYNFWPNQITVTDLLEKSEAIEINSKDKTDMYLNQMQDFVDFIKAKKIKTANFQDGVMVQKIIEAAFNSSKNKKWEITDNYEPETI